jgi:N utilization substance protein A
MAKDKIPLDLIVDTVSNEKVILPEVIFEALEAAVVSAIKKKYKTERKIDIEARVAIDHKTGHYDIFRTWTVVADEDVVDPCVQMTLSAAQMDSPDIKIGDIVEDEIESADFSRIAASSARQVIIQKVREAARNSIANDYKDKIGKILSGTVSRVSRDIIFLDLGNNAEAIIKRSHIIPKETYRPGDRVRAVLMDVTNDPKGPQLVLSRTAPEMLRELFKIEVPEVSEGIIEIKAVAREPGVRAKIAVKTNDGRMDPIGACVGMRGARVQAVSNELSGERVDIILWNDNPAQFVMNAMAPAEIVSIVLDEETNIMDIAVKEEFLSQAIGRGGQNIKLASELSGWTLNIMGDKEAKEHGEKEKHILLETFMNKLDIEQEVAEILVAEGFTTIEEVAYVPISEMLEIEDFDEEIVEDLRQRAKDSLLTQEIASKEHSVDGKDKDVDMDLMSVEGMDQELADKLISRNIITRDDLAELSVDEITDITDIDSDRAATLIMAARSHWFD